MLDVATTESEALRSWGRTWRVSELVRQRRRRSMVMSRARSKARAQLATRFRELFLSTSPDPSELVMLYSDLPLVKPPPDPLTNFEVK